MNHFDVSPLYIIAFILVMALATFLTRALGFWVPKRFLESAFIVYANKIFPAAILTLLLLYALKDTPLRTAPHGLPEAISLALVITLQAWRHQAFLSIVGGTLLYMFLKQ